MTRLTVALMTARPEASQPFLSWFFDGLARECRDANVSPADLDVVIVDLLAEARRDRVAAANAGRFPTVRHVEPKPNRYRGRYRALERDLFAPSSARNSVYALAHGSHVVFVEDHAILEPGWLHAHLDAARDGYLLCGLTRGRESPVVDREGRLVGGGAWRPDGREAHMAPGDDLQAPADPSGAWSYGGCFSVSLAAALMVGGADEA